MKQVFYLMSLIVLLAVQVLFAEVDTVTAGTSITSTKMEMESLEEYNIMHFYGDVEVSSEDFHATCNMLEVYACKTSKDSAKKVEGKAGVIEKIIAQGDVFIEQDGKVATSGHAEIYPQEGKVVLEDGPVVKDNDGVVSGYRMVMYRGERKAYIEASPDGERPKVLLPVMPDFRGEGEKVAIADSKESVQKEVLK